MADNGNSPKSWWLLEGAIKGLNTFRAPQNAAVAKAQSGVRSHSKSPEKQAADANGYTAETKFDYDAPVEGMRIINDLEFEVELNEPVYRFMYVLATFQMPIVPREAVEFHKDESGRHSVGTGPFVLREYDWVPTNDMILHRNPNYHEC